ncbi:MAG: MFS transporter [Actinobacteria bacterium]|nr:MFS transporter [Actinomycetota bacterium]NCZ92830.1 MFS transporter [Actinomycetota bacterium]
MSEGKNRAQREQLGRDFRFVWLSILVSSSGDGMFVTAFPLLAAILTRDPVLIAGITISTRLPWLLFSIFTGAIADRMDRRKLMIGADVVRMVIVGALGASILLDAVAIWQLYVCAFLLGICETLHVNAAQAFIPAIVRQDQLLPANARFASAQIVSAQFIGPPLGVAMFNAAHALPFVADAITFAGSAGLIASIPDEHAVEKPTTKFRDDVLDGLRYLRDHKALRRLTEILAFVNFFYFAAISLLVLYNDDILGGNRLTFTALSVSAAVGTVISRFFIQRLVDSRGTTTTMVISMWLWAIATTVMALTSNSSIAIASNAVLGIGTGLWLSLNTTLRQQLTPSRMLGRMNAASRTVSWGIVPFGAAFGGISARFLGLRGPFILSAISMVGCAIIGRRLLRPVDIAVNEMQQSQSA